jgi:hypothetical protein
VTSRNYVKGKGRLITRHRRHRGGIEVWLYSFLTLELDGGGGVSLQHRALAPILEEFGLAQGRSGGRGV